MYADLIIFSTLTFFFSFFLTTLKAKFRIAVDRPKARSSHTLLTPTGGGFAALIAFCFFILWGQDILNFPDQWRISSPIIISALILGVVGLLDDIFSLPAVPRLFIQFALATWVVHSFDLELLVVLPESTVISGGFSQILAILWIVGFVNLYNFMDGANGMIAIGTIVASLLIIIASPSIELTFVSIGLAAAMIGFLPLNFPKARIFLGDSGSQSFGFLLACLLLSAHGVKPNRFSLYTMILAFLPYLYDAGVTTFIRLFKAKNILKPHREFIFHKLMIMGFKHYMVSFIYMIILIICGIGVEFSSRTYVLNHFIILMIALFFMTLFRSVVMFYDSKYKSIKKNENNK